MINFRLLIVQAWKIIWRSPYIWVISLVMTLVTRFPATSQISAWVCAAGFLSLLVNFFGQIGLIFIVERLYRNEIVNRHLLLGDGLALLKRTVRIFLTCLGFAS
jgi:hypothetical protein